MKKIIFSAIFLIFFTFSSNSYQKSDSLQCTIAIRSFEKRYNIPENFLYTIAMVESGRWDKKINKKSPWPWSLNINGKAMFFSDRKTMISKLKALIQSGKTNIDIGCSQINYKHHHKNFDNLEQMTNPYYNVRYAARYLLDKYKLSRNWEQAIALYHSSDPNINSKYMIKILNASAEINN